MQRKSLVIAAAIAGLLGTAAHSQSLPQLMQGMDYAKAHRLLIDGGWQMTNTNPMHCMDSEVSSLQRRACKEGYTNVLGCTANGFYCRYEWQDVTGKKLITVSFGHGRSGFDAVLNGWRFE